MTAPASARRERDHQQFANTHSATHSRSNARIPAERSMLARYSDPDTSHDAGNSQTESMGHARQAAILDALRRYGPMTDEQLVFQLDAMRTLDPGIPHSTPQAFRTARKALQDAGRVTDTGRREATAAGRTAVVWAVAGDAQ